VTSTILTSGLRKQVSVVRWLLPLILTIVVTIYETIEHVIEGPEPIGISFYAEVGFFGILGPALVGLTLTWIAHSLAAREQAEADIRRLNTTLERQVAERTRSLAAALRELEQKNLELQTLDQLKSDFVSLVSHELRAPLTNINGGIELLLSSPGLEPHCRDTLRIIGEQSQRLTSMVKTILDVSAIEALRWPLNPGPVALSPLAQASVRQMLARAGNRQIVWQGDEDLAFAWVDENSLAQVLTNLLDNAIKFGPDDSTITVDSRATTDSIRISVSDQGPGIPPEERERVFDKFHRLDGRDDRRVYDHGLGLYMARGLVEMQEGQIWVEGNDDGGARFVVELPRFQHEETP